MDPAAASAVAPTIAALGALPELVAIVLIVAFGALVLAVLFRLPAVADAVARVRGKGETDRERDLSAQVEALTTEVRALREQLRAVEHRWEEQKRVLETLLPRLQCLVPGCQQAEIGDVLRALLAD